MYLYFICTNSSCEELLGEVELMTCINIPEQLGMTWTFWSQRAVSHCFSVWYEVSILVAYSWVWWEENITLITINEFTKEKSINNISYDVDSRFMLALLPALWMKGEFGVYFAFLKMSWKSTFIFASMNGI